MAVVAPLGMIVPTVESPPAIPFTLQLVVASAARQNEAVKVCDCPSPRLADAGAIELAANAQVIVTVALADLVGSAALVAVTVTLAGVGTVTGAA